MGALSGMSMFQQLQALVLVAIVIVLAPAVLPPLRRHNRTLRLAALVIYGAGGLAVLAEWLLKGH